MKKEIILTTLLTFLLAFSFVAAEGTTLSEPTSCCEKTTNGAFCVNAPQEQCDTGYKSSPTSCETTSYCSLGTCYDSDEGICMENTPQTLCEEQEGTWDARDINAVPQCSLGCCIIGEQAAFVSLTRCKKLSTFYGVENNYDPSITSELTCIATAQAQDTGACVYESEFERICEFTTREDCGASDDTVTIGELGGNLNAGERLFYKDVLCSAEELGTTCARQTRTTCFEGDVYWTDSCGNRENVYSNDKTTSWNNGRALDADEVCQPGDTNCGNCDYFQGTRCDAWSGTLGIGKPAGADHFCRQTECVDREGNSRINGESWCVYDGNIGQGKDTVGSRHFRELCDDGEIIVEACADYRNEICIGNSIETSDGDFGTAACRVNRWQDCILQVEEDDCINTDKRDCQWLPEVKGMLLGSAGSTAESRTVGFSNPTSTFNNPTATGGITGNAVLGEPGEAIQQYQETGLDGVCVPNFAPGIEFWKENNNQQQCGTANAECVIRYEKGIIGERKLVEGKECLEEQWALQANRVCTALGDCGGYTNFANDYTDDGYTWFQEGYGDDGERTFSPNAVNIIKRGFSGLVIAQLEGEQTA